MHTIKYQNLCILVKKYIINKHAELPHFKIYLQILKDLQPEDIQKYDSSMTMLKPYFQAGVALWTIKSEVKFIKQVTFSNARFSVLLERNKEKLHELTSEFVSMMPNILYDISLQHDNFVISDDSIIDILRNTMQGDKMFIDREDEIRRFIKL